jgi:Family of unknown function (DUF6069)
MAVSTLSAAQSQQVTIRKIPVAALVGGVVGAIANVIVFFIAQALGVVWEVVMGPAGSPLAALPIAAVVIASIVPALAAGALLALLARFTKRPLLIFWIIAGVFLLLSMFPIFTMPVAGGVQAGLAVMHIIAGAAITWALSTRT